ncbi:efflux pump vrtL [Trichoderma asperellum]|uniref:Efflux pump vrtL n=1 Tax=Trichoderma asperellum TaxID=101201 RepID=A0A6V8QWU2_TRIAP|nr:efflux pump vrtL [Trichoderma asperellum]
MIFQGEKRATDVETGAQVTDGQQNLTEPRLPGEEVTWDSSDDPENPYNWSLSRKVSVALVYSTSQLVTTMSASMVAPAMDQILKDLHMSPSAGQVAFGVFFLGLGFTPFLVAPLAEMYGRKPIWLIGNLWYIVWNSLCPIGFSAALMIIGRFMCASGACVGVTLTGPVLADMFPAKDRGQSLAIAGLLPYLGPALGPIIGGLAAERLWWPWLFWILSAFDALALVLGFFIIQESYTPVLLRRKAEFIAAQTVHTGALKKSLTARLLIFYQDLSSRIGPAMKRPIRLLTHRPIIQLIALAMAVDFGIYTLILSTFASLWIKQYRQNETDASLHYIAIALGAFVCAQAGGRLMDLMWHRMKSARPDREPTPEWRVPYILVGLIPCVAGTFWYAWSAEKCVHWAVVDVGVFFFTAGNFMFSQGLLAYNFDEFTSMRAASASAATRLGTYLLGFVFPIFAPELYEKLGYGWGNSLLGFLYGIIGMGIIVVLWIWGEKIRAMGRTAEDSKERLL